MATILVLNGPNLNLLGLREPHIYGSTTLTDLHSSLIMQGHELGHQLTCQQHNSESNMVEAVQRCFNTTDYLILNPAAFTHTSIALRDAILAVQIPFIEVHLSNIYGREPFRQHSYFSDIARGVISGFGVSSYTLALQAVHQLSSNH